MGQSAISLPQTSHRKFIFLVIALVTLSIEIACDRHSKPEQGARKDPSEIRGEDSEPPLLLEGATLASSDGTIRMNLVRRGEAKYSSGESNETHNILFIPAGKGASHWLLPDHRHRLSHEIEIRGTSDSNAPEIATVAIVLDKDAKYDSPGRLILFDPTGEHFVEVAQNVLSIELASRTKDDITLLYRREGRFIRATFDSVTLANRNEREIEIPGLK